MVVSSNVLVCLKRATQETWHLLTSYMGQLYYSSKTLTSCILT